MNPRNNEKKIISRLSFERSVLINVLAMTEEAFSLLKYTQSNEIKLISEIAKKKLNNLNDLKLLKTSKFSLKEANFFLSVKIKTQNKWR
jgi:hypothetical protein